MSVEQLKTRLPSLKHIISVEDSVWDVQFCPYLKPDADPVFAWTGESNTVVYRVNNGGRGTLERLCWFVAEDEKASSFSLTWSLDSETNEPLLCVAGPDAKIKILNVATGKFVKMLYGHGATVNNMKTSPIDPGIIATGAEDSSIRIWQLHPNVAHQPCAAVLGGEGGHESGLTQVAFHSNGRYLLSGGYDTRICLWVLPEYPSEPDQPYGFAGSDDNIMTQYPHFCTTAVHAQYIDCLTFHNDLILSKSCGRSGRTPEETYNRILLWRITGFNSRKPVPPYSAAPANMPRGIHTTVSAWSDTSKGSGGFQVLMSFEIPGTEATWMRFGLSHPPRRATEAAAEDANGKTKPSTMSPPHGPILAIAGHAYRGSKQRGDKATVETRVHLWDLDLLAQNIMGQRYVETVKATGVVLNPPRVLPKWPEGMARVGSAVPCEAGDMPMGNMSKTTAAPRAGSKLRGNSLLRSRSTSRVASPAAVEQKGSPAPGLSTTTTSFPAAAATTATTATKPSAPTKEQLWGPFTPQPAHKIIEIDKALAVSSFTPRSTAWSPDGRICVIAGNDAANGARGGGKGGVIWVLGFDDEHEGEDDGGK